jgi:hypothetical protein
MKLVCSGRWQLVAPHAHDIASHQTNHFEAATKSATFQHGCAVRKTRKLAHADTRVMGEHSRQLTFRYTQTTNCDGSTD